MYVLSMYALRRAGGGTMSRTDAGPDIVYRGRRGAWTALVLLALLDGGLLVVCGSIWDSVTTDDDWASSGNFPVALVPVAVLAASLACTIVAARRAWQGRPRLILTGNALTYQGLFRTRQARWSDLGVFILWTKRAEVSDDSGIGPSTRVVETDRLAAPLSGKRALWLFWKSRQFRIPDSFDIPLAQIQAELNRHVRGRSTGA
jgi:hypothetical protein